MPTLPSSLMTTAVPWPSGVLRKRCTSVVFPAPRNPVTMVTGMRAPRARLSLRPNRPASREGRMSSISWTCVSRMRCSAARAQALSDLRRKWCAAVHRWSGTATNSERRRGRKVPGLQRIMSRAGGRAQINVGALLMLRCAPDTGSKIHLQNVEAADVAIDGVDDLALVHEHVVELHGGGRRHGRGRGHAHTDLPGLVGIGNVIGAQSAVEEGAEHDLVRLPRRRHRHILMNVVRAKTAGGGKGLVIRHGAGGDRNQI